MRTPDRTKCMQMVASFGLARPCGAPSTCQQVGSGIPLCERHGAFLRKHGAKTVPLKNPLAPSPVRR